MRHIDRIILLVTLSAINLGSICAQEHSLGTTWSFTGIGLSYAHVSEEDGTILHAGIQAEAAENFLGRRGAPGVSAAISLDTIFASKTSNNGNKILLHAGPGFMAGYCKDFRLRKRPEPHGIVLGLKGHIGTTIIYNRNVNISLGISPVIGVHITSFNDNTIMKYYRYGLLRILMPEIGIMYRF